MIRFLGILLLACMASPSYAIIDCVYSAAELHQAFMDVEQSGSNAIIYLHKGSYAGPFSVTLPPGKSLYLRGGFTNCAAAASEISPATSTTIDGMDLRAALSIDPKGSGEIRVEGIRFTNGGGTASQGGGLTIRSSSNEFSGDININRVVVDHSRAGVYGGAISAWTTAGKLTVTNSWLHENITGSSGGTLHIASPTVFVCGNTIVKNAKIGSLKLHTVGVSFQNFGISGEFINNIITDNGSDGDSDVSMYGVNILLKHNDIGVLDDEPADGSYHNLSVDPGFLNVPGNMWKNIKVDSPLIDVGGDCSSMYDADGYPRKVGVATDFGAFEFQADAGNIIFIDGFDL